MNTSKSIVCSVLLLGLTLTTNAQTQKGNDIDGEAARDESGFSVSMPDDRTIAIGAKNNYANSLRTGHVRIYAWDSIAWVQKGIDIDGEAHGDRSGSAISMPDDSTVAIGAPGNGENGTRSGHVRIYRWNDTAWVQKGLDIDGEETKDESGWSVSMPDANTVAIGAPTNDGNGDRAGHVRIYRWKGSTWVQKGFDIDGEEAIDESGWSVSMPDSNTIAIGAPTNDGNGADAGHVRIYRWNGNAWVQKGMDIDGEAEFDGSGKSVSMPDSNTVAIGASGNDNANGSNAGHVRIYWWNGTAWAQKGQDIDGEAAHDGSGGSVSMPDSNTIAIGANGNGGNGSNAGHVRIYSWNGNAWVQKDMDIDGEAADDRSGRSVSMPDANTVAIGALYNDGNGSKAGHVRVYSLSSEEDCSSKGDIDGDGTVGFTDFIILTDNFGAETNNISLGDVNSDGIVDMDDFLVIANNFGFLCPTFEPSVNGKKSNVLYFSDYPATQQLVAQLSAQAGIKNPLADLITTPLVYPNPNHGDFVLDLGSTYKEIEIAIKNMQGQEVTKEVYPNTSMLQLTLPSERGAYFVEVVIDNKKAVLKVVKE